MEAPNVFSYLHRCYVNELLHYLYYLCQSPRLFHFTLLPTFYFSPCGHYPPLSFGTWRILVVPCLRATDLGYNRGISPTEAIHISIAIFFLLLYIYFQSRRARNIS